jgi:hypothetical protein
VTHGSKYATAQIIPTPVCFFAWFKTCEATDLKREEKDGRDGGVVLAEGVAPDMVGVEVSKRNLYA